MFVAFWLVGLVSYFVCMYTQILLFASKVTTLCFSKLRKHDLVFQSIRGFQHFAEHNEEDLHRISSRVVRFKM